MYDASALRAEIKKRNRLEEEEDEYGFNTEYKEPAGLDDDRDSDVQDDEELQPIISKRNADFKKALKSSMEKGLIVEMKIKIDPESQVGVWTQTDAFEFKSNPANIAQNIAIIDAVFPSLPTEIGDKLSFAVRKIDKNVQTQLDWIRKNQYDHARTHA
jgi:hypothetical protein